MLSSEDFCAFVARHTGLDVYALHTRAEKAGARQVMLRRVYRRIKNRESAQRSRDERAMQLDAAHRHENLIKQLTERVDLLERQLSANQTLAADAQRLRDIENAFAAFMEQYEAQHPSQECAASDATCSCCHAELPPSDQPLESIFGH